MRIIHIIHPDKKFAKTHPELLNKYFDHDEHDIIYLNDKNDTMINDDIDLKQFEYHISGKFDIRAFYRVLVAIRKYDYIILHSLFFNALFKLVLLIDRSISGKLVWIEFGGDLYNSKNILNKLIVRKLCLAVCIFEPDVLQFKRRFPSYSQKVLYAPYCKASISEKYLNYSGYSRLHQTNMDKDTIWIQVGHSASNDIDHIAVLKALEKFKNDNIKIILPLSYGDMNIADNVQKCAEQIFSDKVLCLREFMSSSEYFKLLSRVDIAIFDTSRQIALGNIYHLVFHNTKLYLSDNSVMFNYFIQQGVPVQPISKISSQSFEEFREECSVIDEACFQEFIKSLSDMDSKLRLWKDIYDYLAEHQTK